MRPSTKVATLATATAMVMVGACSLDLDESLIGKGRDAGNDVSAESSAGVGGSAGAGDAAGATAGGAGGSAAFGGGGAGGSAGGTGGFGAFPDAGACDASSQCALVDAGCLVGECVSGSCLYEICPGTTRCEAPRCEQNACTAPQPYTFHAHELTIQDGLSCATARDCVAAMGDFVLVGTAAGLKAWRVTNASDPQPVAIDQPPFAILALVATEARTLVVGPKAGGKLSLAWIDLPPTPLVPRLASASVAVDFAGGADVLYPADGGNFLLMKASAAELFPTAYLQPPITPNSTVTQYPSTDLPSGATVVAASGTRLVTYRTDSTTQLDPRLSFESNAGQPTAQNEGEVSLLADVGEVPTSLAAHRFSIGRNGSVLWTTNSVTRTDAGSPQAEGVSLLWPVMGGDTAIVGTRKVMLESYSPAQVVNSNLSGPAAQIGTDTVLATVADPGNVGQTEVLVVRLAGDVLTVDTDKRWVLESSPAQLAVVAGSTFGYILTPATLLPAVPPKLHVFDPECK